MDADSSDVLVVRVISVSSEGTVATWVENADTRCIEMGGVEARYVKFTGIETRGDGSNNNKWVTCGECNAKKEVTEDTTPTVEPAKPTEPTEPTKPAEETLTPVLCTDMTVTGFSSEKPSQSTGQPATWGTVNRSRAGPLHGAPDPHLLRIGSLSIWARSAIVSAPVA